MGKGSVGEWEVKYFVVPVIGARKKGKEITPFILGSVWLAKVGSPGKKVVLRTKLHYSTSQNDLQKI